MKRSILHLLSIALLSFFPVVGLAEVGRSEVIAQQQDENQTKNIANLIQQLRTGNESEAESACKALKELGQPAINSLIPLLKDSNPAIRWTVANILGEMGYTTAGPLATSAIPYLIPLLGDLHPGVRSSASGALGHMSASVPFMIPLLKDNDVRVRSGAAFTLGLAGGDTSAVPSLMTLLKDADAEVRSNAAYALGMTALMKEPPKLAIPSLIQLLKDPDATVRARAAEAIAHIGRSVIVPPRFFPIEQLPVPVAETGSRLGNTDELSELAIPALIPLLKDPNARVQFSAAQALRNLGYKP
jgi:HEAT repeat protein